MGEFNVLLFSTAITYSSSQYLCCTSPMYTAVVKKGSPNAICCGEQSYNPETEGCCQGQTVYDLSTQRCCPGRLFNFCPIWNCEKKLLDNMVDRFSVDVPPSPTTKQRGPQWVAERTTEAKYQAIKEFGFELMKI